MDEMDLRHYPIKKADFISHKEVGTCSPEKSKTPAYRQLMNEMAIESAFIDSKTKVALLARV